MATHVYANGKEIASKSADGSSRAAFPDVCHTPPPTASGPFPPGVPIPYPNTCHASDITNGSRSVFILGKEIALENHSYFSVSEGDDAATRKLAKGLISRAVKGRCFFQTWSPNVFVEGRAVARHLDMVSHNHRNPSNTALFPYLSRGWFGGHDCKKEEGRINEACGEGGRRPKPSRRTRGNNPAGHWTRDFCTGLNVGSNIGDPRELRAELEEMLDSAAEQFAHLEQGFWSHLGGAAASGAGKLLARSGVRVAAGAVTGAAAGLLGGPAAPATSTGGAAIGATVGTVVSAVDTVWTVISGLWGLPENWAAANAAADLFGEASDMFEGLDRILGPDGSLNVADSDLARTLGDWQDMIAKMNPCLRARKCSLVPHRNRTGEGWPRGGNVEPSNSGGCCPGQQGHHLIPQTVMDGVDCPNYRDGSAPTVCVEGGRGSGGSHARIHDKFDEQLRDLLRRGRVTEGNTMTMADAIDAAVASHQEAFPLSRCRSSCIRAQLTDYYNSLCRHAMVNAKYQDGSPVRSNPVSTPQPSARPRGGRG